MRELHDAFGKSDNDHIHCSFGVLNQFPSKYNACRGTVSIDVDLFGHTFHRIHHKSSVSSRFFTSKFVKEIDLMDEGDWNWDCEWKWKWKWKWKWSSEVNTDNPLRKVLVNP